MTTHDEVIERLQGIILADDSTNDQGDAARAALDKLINAAMAGHFESIRNRTADYIKLRAQLAAVVDSIQANQLTGTINRLDGILASLPGDPTSEPDV